MKAKLSKVHKVLIIIALILLFCLGVFSLFKYLAACEGASENDVFSFAGGIIGSLIAGMVAVATFYCTLKNNDKN